MDPKFTIQPRLLRSPTDFEDAAADWMRVWGHQSVRRTNAGRDGGIDVESAEAVAQVKAWMIPVGSPEIQRLKGAAYDGRVALFFSLTDYTLAAVTFADQAGVALFRFCGYNGEVEPVNGSARNHLAERTKASNQSESIEVSSLYKLFDNNSFELEQILKQLIAAPANFCILSVKGPRNRFVQAISVGHGGLQIECVGDGYLLTDEELTLTEISRLADLGWPPAPHTDNGNYQLLYDGPLSQAQISTVSELLSRTLIEVFGARQEDIEVTIDR